MKFVWVPSIKRFRRTEGEVKKAKQNYEVLEIETDKDSLIDRFNAYEEQIEQLTRGGHTAAPQESIAESAPEQEESVAPPPPLKAPAPSYSDWSLRIEDEWTKLPLAMKLHFAADAMECAREAIPDAKSQVDPTRAFTPPSSDGAVSRTEHSEEAAA